MAQDVYKDGKLNAIRNPDGIWINTQVFKEAGLHFEKYGYYIADPFKSYSWQDYWSEERRRCIEGYSVGGARITGDHYFYLNYSPILKLNLDTLSADVGDKYTGCPDFWDGDYNYFWIREIAQKGIYRALLSPDKVADFIANATQEAKEALFNSLLLDVKIPFSTTVKVDGEEITRDNLTGGFNLIVGKARRKGYSLKNAACAANCYFTVPNSTSILLAWHSNYLEKGIYMHTLNAINHVNTHTGWSMPSDVSRTVSSIRASHYGYVNGTLAELGFKSSIQSLTFKDNPSIIRGKNAKNIFYEEAGASGTPGQLIESYRCAEDCVRAGHVKTGLITVFGTSGNLEGGACDFADMIMRPEAFGMMPFWNIWDEKSDNMKTGFFHPDCMNMDGLYDKQGNSDKEAAKRKEKVFRAVMIKNGATYADLQQRMQEHPNGPIEAFGSVSTNSFPVAEIKQQILKIKSNNWQHIKGTPVELIMDGGEVRAKPILNGQANPILSYYNVPVDKRGCVMVYEYPVPDPPRGLYKIGYDPVQQDTGTSLAAIAVYKSVHKGTQYHDILVAEYVGRRESTDDLDRLAEYIAVFYNATIMHENMTNSTINFFRRRKRLDLLAKQPDKVISKNIMNSKVARVYGCHLNVNLIDAGERYFKEWLLTELDYDENGDPVRVLDRIYSIRLLEEAASYNRQGNFDLISAMFMCLFQVQEEEEGKVYNATRKTTRGQEMDALLKKMPLNDAQLNQQYKNSLRHAI